MIRSGDKTFDNAEARWRAVGPYYAMFPSQFADRVIELHTEPGDAVLDPFAGRGTAIYSAAVGGRHGLGIEINPVGWIYAATKIAPASQAHSSARLEEVGKLSNRFRAAAKAMPKFYHHCFGSNVLSFLLAARAHLDWRKSIVDRTLMTLILIDLHGKRGASLSNQMRQTKCMAPEYAIRWWAEHDMKPPDLDAVEFIQKKMKWRYARGLPSLSESRVYLGDSTHQNAGLRATVSRLAPDGVRLLLTSPPYLGITNYHYDQWLRLWMLGGAPLPRSIGEKFRGKFESSTQYRSLLISAFTQARTMLAADATVYVRTDRRTRTAKITREVLQQLFPTHRYSRRLRPVKGKTQTRLFGNAVSTQGEIDFVLHPA